MNINIIFTPKDIHFTPSENAADEVADYLEELLGDDVDFIDVSTAARLTYIDEGDSEFSHVGCPLCGQKIQAEGEHADWVQNLREELIGGEDVDLDLLHHSITMPCCGQNTPVTSLDFDGKAGFGRFIVTLEGADIEGQKVKIAKKISKLIGAPVVTIEQIST